MTRLSLLLASAATLAFAVPALAADVVYEEPAAPMVAMPAPTWTGLYLGIQGGGAFNPDNGDNLAVVPNFAGAGATFLTNAFGNSFSSEFDSSFIGGGHVGFDYQAGQFVVGVLADINALDVSQTASAFSNTPAFYTAERSLDYLVTGRVRAGYLVTPTALAYATGGVAYGEVDYGFSSNSPAINATFPALLNEDEDEFGYTVGGGMEVKVTNNISFGAEYLYTNLGGGDSSTRLNGGPFDGSGSSVVAGQFTDFKSSGDFDFHTVTAKLSYRFN
ncbi:outer membrane protein [Aureimonas pseudogalii]|uniref:Outer membrane immunogenic protein n=1 Tax=Aureimonas pseudogalii TaxID=1744844 RepID=A0A7W6ECT6_9HYPH|nr:outer membrane beta-barrel protein [Aureimonas pseudogalii]MBB3997661.1 outer membrane immunogenic protein [Aureimonas pseudogalii]